MYATILTITIIEILSKNFSSLNSSLTQTCSPSDTIEHPLSQSSPSLLSSLPTPLSPFLHTFFHSTFLRRTLSLSPSPLPDLHILPSYLTYHEVRIAETVGFGQIDNLEKSVLLLRWDLHTCGSEIGLEVKERVSDSSRFWYKELTKTDSLLRMSTYSPKSLIATERSAGETSDPDPDTRPPLSRSLSFLPRAKCLKGLRSSPKEKK